MTKENWNKILELFKIPEEFGPWAAKMLSGQECELILAMENNVIPDADLKQMIADQGISETPDILIQNAYQRKVISKARDAAGNLQWKIADFYARYPFYAQYEYDEYKKFPEDVKKRLNEWDFEVYYGIYADDVKQKMQGIETHVHNSDYLTLPEAEAFIEKHKDHIYIVPCNCKMMMDVTQKPRCVCMNFNAGDNSEWDRGHGEKVTVERAKELIRYFNSQGLMQNGEDFGICNCDGDSCYPLQMARKAGSRGFYPRSKYLIHWDPDKCKGCGKCAKICNFHAFTVEGKKQVKFHEDLCWGCTLCTEHCKFGAISMTER